MAEAMMGFSMSTSSSPGFSSLRQRGSSYGNHVPVGAWQQVQLEGGGNGVYQRKNCGGLSRRVRVNAVPAGDQFHLMAVLVQHMEGQRDLITVKSIWHLSDQAIKNVYMFYIMFFCWGCLFFGSTKDPYYDSEAYRKDGGDGTGHWVYEKQEDIEEAARAALWREELIEEIEQKVDGLPELEEATTKK
ncbi:unnamed protein product [Linum tenue]|uniref:Photosynthetic NDH subcomplex B 4 n=1 Tax=Linum tenue TaxID=586396 RepID=A0AAV0RVA0_9ROSI|nr:unnamed protein product [Linum tenue]